MKIAVLAHIRHAIAEPFSGGMEAHCAGLYQGLRDAGHDVTLFAAAGSTDSDLVEICEAPYEAVLPWNRYRGTPQLTQYQDAAFDRAKTVILNSNFDVIHNNSLYPGIIEWAALHAIPCVTSQHVPPFKTMADAVAAASASAAALFTVTSDSQLLLWDGPSRRNMRCVPNGIDTDVWRPGATVGDYFSWAGRIVPNKGLAEAITAARIAGVKLRIYGPIEDVSYFTDRIEPLLRDGVEYHGHARGASLAQSVAGARGALVTPLWDEPFGLVAAEALACGVPVLAFDRGAMREVIGHCGTVVPPGDVDALAAAIGNADRIDRAGCRKRAVEHLSLGAMIAKYESCYASAIRGAADAAPYPVMPDTVPAAA